MFPRRFQARPLTLGGIALWLSFTCACPAQAPKTGSRQGTEPVDSAATSARPPLAPAQPAHVTISGGRLTIDARNSDFTGILRQVAQITGMTIIGLDSGPRVFGIYGPGNARDVLTSLLVDSGYNFMMVGSQANGIPRELVLTPRTHDAPAQSTAQIPSQPADDEEQEPSEPLPAPIPYNDVGPGAIVPAPPQNHSDGNTRSEQNMLHLQHSRQQTQQNAPQ
ncbi:MAG TPA: hypothetical protein VMU48_13390 [Terracidiphilus sp.]|nr:hypothetical protein [Terracidiphilus sp.]